jgi:hypothetical protein
MIYPGGLMHRNKKKLSYFTVPLGLFSLGIGLCIDSLPIRYSGPQKACGYIMAGSPRN